MLDECLQKWSKRSKANIACRFYCPSDDDMVDTATILFGETPVTTEEIKELFGTNCGECALNHIGCLVYCCCCPVWFTLESANKACQTKPKPQLMA